MIYIFLDTNIFIHFQDFESIAWNEVVSSSDEITITLAPVVIDELDKHKYNPIRKVSNRAKKILPKLESIIDQEIECKYNLLYISSRPSDDLFPLYKLDKKEQDDLLLASILEFKTNLSGDDSILLVTNDVGPRLKAKSLQIQTVKLPEKYQLKNEPDEIEKKHNALQKELALLKNNTPIVKLYFEPDLLLLNVPRRKEVILQDEYVEEELNKIKEDNPFMTYYPPDKIGNTLSYAFSNSMLSLSEDQVTSYNKNLEEFYNSYKNYLQNRYKNFAYIYNSVEVVFRFSNIGFAPASDIDIHLHFPDGFSVLSEEDLPKAGKKPSKPYKPSHRFDIMFPAFSPLNFNMLNPVDKLPSISKNVSVPSIKRSNSYDVKWHIGSLKHNQSIKLDKLYLHFENIHIAEGFTIDYKIMAANIPNLITGQLHVSFEK